MPSESNNRPVLSIILPTYNEAGNINHLINKINYTCKIYFPRLEIIIVDDDSPDDTAKKVISVFKNNRSISVIIRKKIKGLATAIKTGILKAKGDYILIMDTDFNHDPKEIPKMMKLIKPHNLIIGSRYVNGGGMENKMRERLSWLFNLYLRFILGHHIHDNLSGFFLMNRKDLLRFNLDNIFYGFGDYFIRLTFYCHKTNFSIIEIPVYYKNRKYGASKSRFLRMFVTYTKCAFDLRYNDKKITYSK